MRVIKSWEKDGKSFLIKQFLNALLRCSIEEKKITNFFEDKKKS